MRKAAAVQRRSRGQVTYALMADSEVRVLELDLTFFAIAGPAVIFAGISKGGFGSGAAFLSAVVLAMVVEPALALGVMLPLLMLVDAVTLKPFWRKWEWRESWLLMVGSIPGVALGAWFYASVNADAIRVLIGAIAVLFVLWQLSVARGWINPPKEAIPDWGGVGFGTLAGFTSFVSHAGGPPAAIFLLSRGMGKTAYQASSVLVFWVINIAKFIPYAFIGFFTLETAFANAVLAPFALIGAWIGVKAHYLMPERWFFAFTYTALLVTGARLIWLGMT